MDRQKMRNEIARWVAEGVIDAATGEKLSARYPDTGGKTWRSVLLPAIGAVLVGLGVIALLAANWDEFSRPIRAILSITPLFACSIVWAVGEWRGWKSAGFREPLGILWGLSIGAGIALVAQTYHISGRPEDFTLTWTLLLLVPLYLTRSMAVGCGYAFGLFLWVCNPFWWSQRTVLLPFLGYMVLAAPFFYLLHHRVAGWVFAWWALFFTLLGVSIRIPAELGDWWMLGDSTLFATLFLLGIWLSRNGESLRKRPLPVLSVLALAGHSYLLTFQGYWNVRHLVGNLAVIDTRQIVALSLFALLLIAWAALLVLNGKRAWRERDYTVLLWGLVPVAVTVAFWVKSSLGSNDRFWAVTAMLLYIAVLAVATLATGLQKRRLLLTACGSFLFLALVCSKFFASEYTFTVRGIVFIVCGLLFFVSNWFVSRRFARQPEVSK